MEDVAWAAHITTEPDAYVAEDATIRAVRELLAKGYRWVRTDGDWAVFEKEITGGQP
jgi:methionine aminopeptidase